MSPPWKVSHRRSIYRASRAGPWPTWQLASCNQRLIQLKHDRGQLLPKHPARPRKPTLIGERRQVEVVDLHIQARRDVVAHHAEPLLLLVRERASNVLLLGE